MTEFLVALSLFVAAHVIPPTPCVRAQLVAWVGRRVYLVAYSIVSLALIIWVIVAAMGAPYVSLWNPEPWQVVLPILVMPVAAWLLIAGAIEPNPLSISILPAGPETKLGPASKVTRHPLLWAFLLWAASHIPPNGNLVALGLFGSTALLAIGGFLTMDRRAQRRLGRERWQAIAAGTSIIPFAAVLARKVRLGSSVRLLSTIALALITYAWFLFFAHAHLIGLDPLARLGAWASN